VTLARTPELDVAVLSRALEILKHAPGVLGASDALRAEAGIPVAARDYLSSTKAALSAAERIWLENSRHHVVPFPDPHYPVLLREAGRYPTALYVAGDLRVLNDPQLAVVGSRNPTAQGRDTAHEFSEYLAGRGLVITSGLRHRRHLPGEQPPLGP
jgi:DNA processing protein